METKNIPLLLLMVFSGSDLVSSLKQDYYWRDYASEIPDDAFIGGVDVNGRNIYVGQVYYKNRGIMVVQINPGETQVKIPIAGVSHATKGIKILCSQHLDRLKWIELNGDKLHLQLIGKHPVIGGLEDYNVLHVGRISREGSARIRKIISWLQPALMYYVFNSNKEEHIDSYEILLYDETTPFTDPNVN